MTELNASAIAVNRHISKAVRERLRHRSARLVPCGSMIGGISLQNTDLRASLEREIARREESEAALRESEERYALAVDALAGADVGTFDWDLATDRVHMAPRAQELLGIPVGQAWRAREEWRRLVNCHPEDAPRAREAVEAHLCGQAPICDLQVRILLAGEVRWMHLRGRALRDADGHACRMTGSIRDITERKREQKEVQRLENRLRQAERFEAMGALVGGIAHDFNNILGAILGFGERALRSVRTGSLLHDDLSNVIVAGERGRTLVDRVLSFSRGAGERVPVHVEKVVREALDCLQAKLPPRIVLQARLHAGRAALQGDATQIHQVVMNLGTNAMQAMCGAGTLSVALGAVEVVEQRQLTVGGISPGAWIVLTVADEGAGIPPEILPHIFDPFFTTKDAKVGTGLGLSLVRRIVMEIGGAIDVRSETGTGAMFSVYLPRAGDAIADRDDKSLSAPAGRGQRVLVVDDQEPLLELTTDTLRELGYQPVGFASAIDALHAFQADPARFDVVVTDHRMPGMSGDKLIHEIRSICPSLPAILVSGYIEDGVASRSGNRPADDVLAKPLRAKALATSLARLLAAG